MGVGIASAAYAAPVEQPHVTLFAPITHVKAGDTIVVDVLVTNLQQPINTADVTVRFSQEFLHVASVSRVESAMSLWPELPSIDQDGGSVHVVGGIPNGVYAKDARFFTILFTAVQPGDATISVDGTTSALFLNDGQGTRVSMPPTSLPVNIESDFAERITISSSTHPDVNIWSQQNTVRLTWVTQPQLQYSYAFSLDGKTLPDTIPEQSSGSVEYPELADGRYAFFIQSRDDSGTWSSLTQRWFYIDRTVPEPFTIEQLPMSEVNGATVLSWQVHDTGSEVTVMARVGSEDIGEVHSPFTLRSEWLKRTMTLTATDEAGNSRTATWTSAEQSGGWEWPIAFSVVGIAIVATIVVVVARRRRI